jgi:hypothetical protein
VRRFLTVLLPPRMNTDPTRPVAQTAPSSQARRTFVDRHLLAVEALRLGLRPTISRMRFVSTPPTPTYTHPLAIIFPGQPYGRHCDSGYDDTHDPRRHRR